MPIGPLPLWLSDHDSAVDKDECSDPNNCPCYEAKELWIPGERKFEDLLPCFEQRLPWSACAEQALPPAPPRELICDGALEHDWMIDIIGNRVCKNCHALGGIGYEKC